MRDIIKVIRKITAFQLVISKILCVAQHFEIKNLMIFMMKKFNTKYLTQKFTLSLIMQKFQHELKNHDRKEGLRVAIFRHGFPDVVAIALVQLPCLTSLGNL